MTLYDTARNIQHTGTQELIKTKNYHSQSCETVRRSAEGHLFFQQKATDKKRNKETLHIISL